MNNKFSGHLVVNGALALFAGVLGSLLTLLVTSNLTLPVIHDSAVEMVEGCSPHCDNELSAAVSPVPEKPHVADLDQADNHHTQLQASLDDASAERAQLAQVLAQLTVQIESLESDVINQRARESLQDAPQSSASQSALSEFTGPGDFGQPLNAQDRINNLVSAGIDLQIAQAVQARQDQYQLARLDLIDQAEREGWRDSEQFSDRLSALDEQRPNLREELGDDAYDRYLFEAGRNNRVTIASVIAGSAADIAGLAPGDMVMSYAEGRVFSTRDLQSATRAGVRGESVVINVDRQGQVLFFDLPRGPLGVTLSQQQQNPS